jgi:hypothetical protein
VYLRGLSRGYFRRRLGCVIYRLRMLPDMRCEGCGSLGYADEKSRLCCACAGLKMAVEHRKRKLTTTMVSRFAFLGAKIKRQLAEFV